MIGPRERRETGEGARGSQLTEGSRITAGTRGKLLQILRA